jgi:hypothetical protein
MKGDFAGGHRSKGLRDGGLMLRAIARAQGLRLERLLIGSSVRAQPRRAR